jgi:hypothetical protein
MELKERAAIIESWMPMFHVSPTEIAPISKYGNTE